MPARLSAGARASLEHGLGDGGIPAASERAAKDEEVIGFLGSSPNLHLTSSFEMRLRDLGWLDGQNVAIEYRYAAGDLARFPALVDEFVRLKPDVIVAGNHQAAVALRRATAAIPIVVAVLIDPVGLGLVASHARPGGNITGILFTPESLPEKQLALLAEVVPGAVKMGVICALRIRHDFEETGAERWEA